MSDLFALYAGGGNTGTLYGLLDTNLDDDVSFFPYMESAAFWPAGAQGEAIFTDCFLTLTWTTATTIRMTPILDGKPYDGTNGTSDERFVFTLDAQTTRKTQTFDLPLTVPLTDSLDTTSEIGRLAMRGQRIAIRLEVVGYLGDGDLIFDGVWVEYNPVTFSAEVPGQALSYGLQQELQMSAATVTVVAQTAVLVPPNGTVTAAVATVTVVAQPATLTTAKILAASAATVTVVANSPTMQPPNAILAPSTAVVTVVAQTPTLSFTLLPPTGVAEDSCAEYEFGGKIYMDRVFSWTNTIASGTGNTQLLSNTVNNPATATVIQSEPVIGPTDNVTVTWLVSPGGSSTPVYLWVRHEVTIGGALSSAVAIPTSPVTPSDGCVA
jgi:hypothetical protein